MKLLPILVRYFDENDGICTKLIDFHEIPGETSEIVFSSIISTLQKFNISDKMIALSADNTNANFGGAHRKGTKNVYKLMQNFLERSNLIGLGCSCCEQCNPNSC